MTRDFRRRPKRHPSDTLGQGPFTVVGGDVMLTVDRCYEVCGSWQEVCARSGISKTKLLGIRNYERRTMTRDVYERLCAVVGDDPDAVSWYTAAELVQRGIWRDMWGQPTWTNDGRKKKWNKPS